MSTTEEQNKTIDETIKKIKESLKRPSTPTPEPREEKVYEPDPQSVYIDKKIKKIKESLKRPSTPTPEPREEKVYEPDPQSVYIDKKIKEIKDSLYGKQKERNLITLIEEEEVIIQFLTKRLEKAKSRKEDLEEKLECLRYISN